ncbi:hypothetical protein [Serratia liquefaciens]|uniref:hypothetical protein n=1 Tax=Serratia liquefaciens TaxID=614 RepID=UPI00301E4AE2
MTNLNERSQWEPAIKQIDDADRVKGGPSGAANVQAGQLAARTHFLKNLLDTLLGMSSLGEGPYKDVHAAQTDINSGKLKPDEVFSVRSADPGVWVEEYKNSDGVATPTGKVLKSGEAIDALVNIIRNSETDDDIILKIKDKYNFVFGYLTEKLFKTPGFEIGTEILKACGIQITRSENGKFQLRDTNNFILFEFGDGGLRLPNISFSLNGDGCFRVKDKYGFVFFELDSKGNFRFPQTSDEKKKASTDIVTRLNSKNLLASINASAPCNIAVQRPTADINLIVVLGQSFSSGTRSQIALPAEFDYVGNLSLGASPRGGNLSGTAETYDPIGGNSFVPLREVSQGTDGVINLTGPYGETISSGLLNTLKMLHNDDQWAVNDEGKQFAIVCAGVGGKNLAQLSKGATPNLYGRFLTAIQGAKAAADAMGKTIVCCGVVFMQGENSGGTAYDVYYGQMEKYSSDVTGDIMETFGPLQQLPPSWTNYQMGGFYATDGQNLAIGRVHVDFVEKTPGALFGGPVFPYPDPEDHMYANSYRWFGCQLGKVIYRGFRYKPMVFRMTSAIYNSNRMLVSIPCPVPPLRFGMPYDKSAAQDYHDKGFLIKDEVGDLVGEDLTVTIVADTVIQITASRDFVGTVRVTLGDKKYHNGNHSIIDSDPQLARYSWIYTGQNGQPAGENIPALNNKPYPLYNWAASYSLIAVKEDSL